MKKAVAGLVAAIGVLAVAAPSQAMTVPDVTLSNASATALAMRPALATNGPEFDKADVMTVQYYHRYYHHHYYHHHYWHHPYYHHRHGVRIGPVVIH